jgi:hypothetical protein
MSDIQIVANIDVLIEMVSATLRQVTFTVVRKAGGAALTGASISMGGISAVTGEDGKAIVGPLEAGTYTYTVTCAGLLDVTGELSL